MLGSVLNQVYVGIIKSKGMKLWDPFPLWKSSNSQRFRRLFDVTKICYGTSCCFTVPFANTLESEQLSFSGKASLVTDPSIFLRNWYFLSTAKQNRLYCNVPFPGAVINAFLAFRETSQAGCRKHVYPFAPFLGCNSNVDILFDISTSLNFQTCFCNFSFQKLYVQNYSM